MINMNFSKSLETVSEFFQTNDDNILINKSLVVRDIRGKFRILINNNKLTKKVSEKIHALEISLGKYASTPFVQLSKDLFDSVSVFNDVAIVNFTYPEHEKSFKLLDRQITGSGWSSTNFSMTDSLKKIPKLSFFGLKGGVGRSTALSILSYDLAKRGKKVILIDLDLESPGLSSLLLPQDRINDVGIIDWIVEYNFIQDKRMLLDGILCPSPLSDNTQGEILIAPAMGTDNHNYMDKLSRVYNDSEGERFEQKLLSFFEAVVEKENPDLILVDSRSGLHDIAALSIVGISDYTLLFGIDSRQSWNGYETLFSFWKGRNEVVRNVRERVKIVQALLPEMDQINRADLFKQKAYDLFSKMLYDQVIDNEIDDNNISEFSFLENDDFAPHYPIKIKWDNRFQEFNPLLIEKGIITKEYLNMCFGELIQWVDTVVVQKEIP